MNIQQSVAERYKQGAAARQEALCCPVDYDPRYLEIIPKEVLERDYGCGDPSRYLRPGETVLDLGSGGGKICFIASQIVGKKGSVIGIDMTPDMLDLARRNAPEVAQKTGFDNVEFRRGQIQDLKTDPDLVDDYLKHHPVHNTQEYEAFQGQLEKFREESPLVADNSIDVVISNCVLNLVDDGQKHALFSEMFRVLKTGGRIAISDIVSDEPTPEHLKGDDKLWSGCISGAMTEAGFIGALEKAGFHAMTVDKFETEPWQIVEGIEYRAVTILAWKGKSGPCIEKNQAVIYKGPFSEVRDDDGHVFKRGERIAVCEKTFGLMTGEPYGSEFIAVAPAVEVAAKTPFDCNRPRVRAPRETKSGKPKITTDPDQATCC